MTVYDDVLADLPSGQPLLVGPGVALPHMGGIPPRSGYLRIAVVAGDWPLSLDLQMNGEARIVDGFGGHVAEERPGDLPVTTWPGGKLLELEATVVLQGAIKQMRAPFAHRRFYRSIEREYRALEDLSRTGGRLRPPQLRLAGAVPRREVTWVLEDVAEIIDEDQGLPSRDGAGDRYLASATLRFMQHSATKAVPLKSTVTKRTQPRRHEVVKGETWGSIARKKLGNSGRWLDLAKRNGHPRAHKTDKPRVGTYLYLPD